jgi:endoglucanase Acf2
MSKSKNTKKESGRKPTAPEEDPPDNIFTPIQQDNILPQVPIGRHHPVPRTGVKDNDERNMHTNKFYANAFLGQQNQPIWTHPYSVWWGKGWLDPGLLQTWGMNVTHVEETDLAFESSDPTMVGCANSQYAAFDAREYPGSVNAEHLRTNLIQKAASLGLLLLFAISSADAC